MYDSWGFDDDFTKKNSNFDSSLPKPCGTDLQSDSSVI